MVDIDWIRVNWAKSLPDLMLFTMINGNDGLIASHSLIHISFRKHKNSCPMSFKIKTKP